MRIRQLLTYVCASVHNVVHATTQQNSSDNLPRHYSELMSTGGREGRRERGREGCAQRWFLLRRVARHAWKARLHVGVEEPLERRTRTRAQCDRDDHVMTSVQLVLSVTVAPLCRVQVKFPLSCVIRQSSVSNVQMNGRSTAPQHSPSPHRQLNKVSKLTNSRKRKRKLECGPMSKLMVALPNIGGALCSTPQSLADAHY